MFLKLVSQYVFKNLEILSGFWLLEKLEYLDHLAQILYGNGQLEQSVHSFFSSQPMHPTLIILSLPVPHACLALKFGPQAHGL